MLSAAIIVFRETLEAALIIGIISAAASSIAHRHRWIFGGIGAGVIGACLVAMFAGQIGELADGMGQEVFNATVLGLAVLMLAWHNIWMSRHARETITSARHVVQAVTDGQRDLSAIAIIIALAVLREGSETVLFLYGIASQGESSPSLLLGGGAGLMVGALVGIALYFGLVKIPVRWFFSVTAGLVLLLAAGMAGQMASFLVQGDLLPAIKSPLWDTSSLLANHSSLGTLLHTLIGYDARPSGMQIVAYLTALCAIGIGMFLARPRNTSVKARSSAT